MTSKVTAKDAVALTIEAQIADEEAALAIEEAQHALEEIEWRLADLEGAMGNVDVYRSLATDADEVAQYDLQYTELQAEMDELLLAQQEQLDALAEIERAKEQAEEAQAIAEDLASGSPEALQRVLLSAQAALDTASVDLAAALTKAADLNTQVEEKNAQINFITS